MTGAANKVSGGNAISPLQSAILDALAGAEKPIAAGAILSRMAAAQQRQDRPTAAQRAALSKSLARLQSRGMVQAYLPEVCRPGRGYLYGLP